MSSSTCCSQVLRRRPGGRFQSAAGGVPVWASIDSCSACEAGVFSGRRQMWPNSEWRLSAIRDGRSGSFVLSLTTALDTLSYHLIPRIQRSACIWKDWILPLSTLRIVHVSEPYNTGVRTFAPPGQKPPGQVPTGQTPPPLANYGACAHYFFVYCAW